MSSKSGRERAGKNNRKEKAIRKDAIQKRLTAAQKELWYGFLRYEKKRGIKNIESYMHNLSQYFKYVNNTHTDVLDFGINEADKFRRYLETATDKNGKPRYTLTTIRSYISMTKRFYHYLLHCGMLKSNPFLEVEKLRILKVRKKQRNSEIIFHPAIPAEMKEPLKDFFKENRIQHTCRQVYLHHMSNYFQFLKENNLTIEVFGIKEVIAYKKWLKNIKTKDGRRYADITIHNFLKNTKRFLQFLTEKGIIPVNPFAEIQRKKRYRGIDKKWISLLGDFIESEITGKVNKQIAGGQVRKLFLYLKKHNLSFGDLQAKQYQTWLMKQKTVDGKTYSRGSIQTFLKGAKRFYDYLKNNKQIVDFNPFSVLRKKHSQVTKEKWKKNLAGFAEYHRLKGRGKRTIEEHKIRLIPLLSYLEEKGIEAFQVKIGDAQEFRGWITEKGKRHGGYVKGTVRNYMATAKTFFDYLKQEKLVYANPFSMLYKTREEKNLPKNILNENEMSSLLDELEQFDKQKDLKAKKKRYICHIIAELMYSTGMRISEAAYIKKEDIDFITGVITLKKTKERRVRKVFLSEYAKHLLHIFVEEMREIVFRGNEKDRLFGYALGSLSNMLNKELKIVSKKKKLKPADSKGFRHAVGYHLLRAGCNIRYIQAILGHNTLRTTELYTRVDKTDLKKVMEKYHPRKWKER